MEVQCAQVEGRQEGPGRWQEGPGNVGKIGSWSLQVCVGPVGGEPGPCRPTGEPPLHLRKVGSQPLKKSLSSEDRICGKGSIWPAGSAFHPESRPFTGRKGGQGGRPRAPLTAHPVRSPRSASLGRLCPSDTGSLHAWLHAWPPPFQSVALCFVSIVSFSSLSLCFLSHSLHVYSSFLPLSFRPHVPAQCVCQSVCPTAPLTDRRGPWVGSPCAQPVGAAPSLYLSLVGPDWLPCPPLPWTSLFLRNPLLSESS